MKAASFLAAIAFASGAAFASYGPPHDAAETLALDPAITDLNGDGRSDILWRNTATGQVYRMLMNGLTITSAGMAYSESNPAWKIVGDADFNGDGTSDLVWRNDVTGQVYVMTFAATGLPSGGGVVYTEANLDWRIVHTPDINGDGRADLLWWNSSTGQVFAVLMNGTAILAQGMVYTEANTNWRIVAVGDLSGSGASNQLVWRNATNGQVYLMTVSYNAGMFSQTGSMIYAEPNTAWKIIATGDFNGDGRSDLLWRNDTTGQVYIMLMNGGVIASAGIVYTEPDLNWRIVAVGDYNGDGRSDLLWRNFADGRVYMMLMNGLAIASQGLVYAEPEQLWRILGSNDYSDDDSLPRSGATVIAAIAQIDDTQHYVPGSCGSNPRINCADGMTPSPTPVAVVITMPSTTGVIGGTTYNYSFRLVAQASGIRVDYNPGTGNITCFLAVDNSLGSSTYTTITGTATLTSQYTSGPLTRLLLDPNPITLETADLTVSGGSTCTTFADTIKGQALPYIQTSLEQALTLTFCGVAGPDLFGKCPP